MRNKYPGTCYVCGKYTPVGFGHPEKQQGKWTIKCTKCASGRTVKETDPEVILALSKTNFEELFLCTD